MTRPTPSTLIEVFKTQLLEMPRKTYELTYFTFNGKYVTVSTIKLWELGRLCSETFFNKSDQKGYILPVFRILEE